jgi:taurine dioxygenase
MRISRLSSALGARVDGLQLADDLPDSTWQQLVDAFTEHQLLVFPAQDLDDGRHVAVAQRFGPIALENNGQVGFVSNHRADGSLGSRASTFHIDYGFFPRPYQALSLYGLEIPPGGTETWFVSGIAAARSLPDDLRRRVDGLNARHAIDVRSPLKETVVRWRQGRLDETYPHAVRPVLWTHARSGRQILAVWEQQTDAIVELEPAAGTALLEELFDHLYRDQHRYVHLWQPGDLVLWDNHALQHGRPHVGVEQPRTLRRVCIGETQDLSMFAAYRAVPAAT